MVLVFRRLSRTSKRNVLYSILFVFVFLYFSGLWSRFFERPFSEFDYPLQGAIDGLVEKLIEGHPPLIQAINPYHGINLLITSPGKCSTRPGEHLRLVYLIKSAAGNFARRDAIRNSWGFEQRFSDVRIATVFLVGTSSNSKVARAIEEENRMHSDLVQADFVDNYYNNTMKTVVGLKWAFEFCPNARFYFFSDDDMYVSTKNLLRPALDFDSDSNFELYSGYLWSGSRPMRHVFSKWFVSVTDYPFDQYPDFIAAGAYVLTRRALLKLYYGSLFTRPFLFDDVYLGIIAEKLKMKLTHSKEFHFFKKEYDVFGYRYVVTSHGYGDPQELLRVWNEQKTAGNA
ncbi:hypothetical protein AAG570_001849 [Ranatra chinensis]|uniref:Hexosyltransferase n=1 Tax=Ranatra chinensis TaxID=642074 RepID=A0ABD0YXZ5_9HEMI